MNKFNNTNGTKYNSKKTVIDGIKFDSGLEIWKDIPGYEGLYQASNLGNIKSLNRIVYKKGTIKNINGKILKQYINTNGYKWLTLYQLGIKKMFRVHRLIALTFISNEENKQCVNHIDGIKTNNNILNLEWCTRSENEKHKYDVLKYKPPTLGRKGFGNKFSKEILQYDKRGVLINIWNNIGLIVLSTGLTSSNIAKVCNGERKTTGGFIFKYKDNV